MNRKWFLLVFTLFLIACNSNKDAGDSSSSKSDEIVEQNDIKNDQTMAEASVHTKMFLSDLEKELQSSQINPFEPSAELIKKYSLINVRGTYYIGGFLQTETGFQEEKLKALGINIGSSSGTIRTCQVPILEVDKLLKIEGISAFNIAEKTLQK